MIPLKCSPHLLALLGPERTGGASGFGGGTGYNPVTTPNSQHVEPRHISYKGVGG
jgi:hypothetical protein